jgi:ethanolamine utilization protein EutN
MELARVIGSVTSTIKQPDLESVKLLVIQPKDDQDQDKGKPLVAVDVVQAGVGDRVWWVAGREAAMALEKSFVGVDAAIVGIVDDVS